MYLYIQKHKVTGDDLVYLAAVVPALNSLSKYDDDQYNAETKSGWIKIDLSNFEISKQLKIYHRIRNNITDIIIDESGSNGVLTAANLKKKGSSSGKNVTNDDSLDDVRTVERSRTFKDAVPRLTIPQGMFSL